MPIYRCEHCSHHFHPISDEQTHIAQVYDDSYFVGSNEGYQDYVAEETLQRSSARFYVRLINRFVAKPGFAIDIGAACGFFSQEFQLAGWKCIGVEPNLSMRELAAQQFQLTMHASLQSLCSSNSLNSSELPAYQLATMIQVISHIPDPRAALNTVHSLLDKNGLLLIETWDRDSLIARLSGKSWHEWNPPSVIHWFTRTTLRKLIEDEGFEFIAQGLPRKRIQIGRAVQMLRHSRKGSIAARILTAPLTLVPVGFAIPYFLGDAFWILVRK
ncbi:MAG: methyltransferase domain-containing protein [Pirellulales bacterium]